MKKIIFLLAAILVGFSYLAYRNTQSSKSPKLYWFIPDGVRAEPDVFTMYAWAKEGKLPNIKKLMDRGSYGYSYPNFPSHTPTNFATLLTGTYPQVNGVNDGPMREVGKPLDAVAVPGFRSTAKKVPPIWSTLEDNGMKVAIVSVPGSTPPEIQSGVVIRGRWGGWGPDFAALNFETKGDLTQRIMQGRAARLFYFGPQLTQYVDGMTPRDWQVQPESFSKPVELSLAGWGATVYAYMYDTSNDAEVNYDRIAFSLDKKTILTTLTSGEWSDWTPITLVWQTAENSVDVPSFFRATVIKLGDDGFFRIRLVYDALNSHITFPGTASDELHEAVGPMVDFVDNFPPQLVYYPEDKDVFMDESDMSFDWHTRAVGAVISKFSPDVIIHDIYTPNQWLTSKWWMGYVDPHGVVYGTIDEDEREALWQEVQDMYKKLDTMVGEILRVSDADTYIVFSSDHGAVPINYRVNLNNLFAQKGWLTFSIDPATGEPIIDWARSKVIYLKMAHIYINPNGLDGDYIRASGSSYEALRDEVIRTLIELSDKDGQRPVVEVIKWEHASEYMKMHPDRIGDLVIANAPGFGWGEEMTSDLAVFSKPLETGYKQAIISKEVPGMWTPFIMAGPGIKKNNYMGEVPFSLIDQYPTIMKALGVDIPDFVQGEALDVFSQ